MKPSPKKVVVVGGGVVGLSCAYFLARAGIEVTVLDERPAEAPNCSTGNAGMVVPSHFIPLSAPGVMGQGLRWMLKPESPFAFRPSLSPTLWSWVWHFYRACHPKRVQAAKPVLRDLSLASREWFVRLRDEDGLEFGLETRGLLALCRTASRLEHECEMITEGRPLGIQGEKLSAEDVAKLEPGVEFDIAGAVYFPQDCHLDPAAFRQALRRKLEAMGATFHWETPVRVLERSPDRLEAVLSDHGSWKADAFVLAGGIQTTSLARHLGLRLPMQPGKGYSLTLQQPAALPKLCSLLMEARVAVTPMGRRLRVGGTMEIGGHEGTIHPAKLRGITQSLKQYYPQFQDTDFNEEPVWTGLRPCTPDGLPYLGPCPGLANTCIATGHAMLGLSLAPISGWCVQQHLCGHPVPMDSPLLAAGRYSPRQ